MLTKQFEPHTKSTSDLFFGSTKYIIPRFQRSYAWKKSQLEDFYADFLKTSETDHQTFLGTLVLDASKDTRLEIIDGQQRIITLTIVLAVIRDILEEDIATPAAIKVATTINNHFILTGPTFGNNKDEAELSPYNITCAKDMQQFFEQFVLIGDPQIRSRAVAKTDGEKCTRDAYNFLKNAIKQDKLSGRKSDEQKITILGDLVSSVSNIMFITIDVYDSDMAYALFESHNAKGADLLISDLVKSYFYGNLKGNEDYKEAQIAKWDELVNQLKAGAGIKIDKFLHYYQQSYLGKFTKAQLYKKIKVSIGSKDNEASNFLKNMQINTDLLLKLKAGEIESTTGYNLPYEQKEKINKSLNYIADFGVEQCYIFLLSLFRNRHKFTPTFLKKNVELIENFTFMYSKISRSQANVLESIYAEYAKQIEETAVDENEIEAFSGRMYGRILNELKTHIDYEIFEPRFKDLDYAKPLQKRLIQYAFAKIESSMNRGGTVLGLDANLDHILAQNPREKTAPIVNIHRIGNLVPIDKASNSKLGNMPLAEKITVYNEIHNVSLIRDLMSFLSENDYLMDEDTINRRGISLANYGFKEVWNLK